MSLQIYSKCLVDIVFGDGQLGFKLGKTDEGFPVMKEFDTKEDGTRLPLEGCGAVKKGDYILSINNEDAIHLNAKEVKSKLKKASRPITVRFAKPCSKSHYKTITTPDGEKKTQKWSERDSYLPVRSYDISHMNDSFIMLRNVETSTEYALTPIFRNGPIFENEIRQISFNGITDKKNRANIWKMLLHSYPFCPSKWSESRKNNENTYQIFVNEFIKSKNATCGKSDCDLVPNPNDVSWKRSADYCISDDDGVTNESKWSRDFGETEMREIIWKDVERTYSDVAFFNEYNKQVMARLLFVFGTLNTGVRYVQGMNELLAPLMYVFAEADMEMDHEITRSIEADTFFAFNNIMSETRDLFLHQLDSSTSGLRGVLEQLHNTIEICSPSIASHLNSLNIDPQYYAVRWLTTLFAREFPLDDTFRIWDALLGDPQRFEFMHCVGCAIVISAGDDILKGDFGEVISLI